MWRNIYDILPTRRRVLRVKYWQNKELIELKIRDMISLEIKKNLALRILYRSHPFKSKVIHLHSTEAIVR